MGTYRYKYFEIVHQIKGVIDSTAYNNVASKTQNEMNKYQVLLTISLQYELFFFYPQKSVHFFIIENNNCFGFVFQYTISELKN